MMRWFAPVGACAVMAMLVFHQEGGFQGGVGPYRAVSLLASNQSATASYEPEVNLVPQFFEWTNRSGSALSIGSFLPGKVN
jgi:hypothetical protein